MPLKADYMMMYNAPWRFLKGKQCEASMKKGKMKYVNHLMKPYLGNSDDSKPVAKTATNIYLSISIYNTPSLKRFLFIYSSILYIPYILGVYFILVLDLYCSMLMMIIEVIFKVVWTHKIIVKLLHRDFFWLKIKTLWLITLKTKSLTLSSIVKEF